jgi:isopenicillin-N epimerase
MVSALKQLFLLDPEIIFLNHGSFGACPRPVFEVYQAWQRQLERQPVLFLGRQLDYFLNESRRALGEYVNAPPDDLVYIHNATHGVNIVARSLQLETGDEILTSDQEYGACDYTWEFVCEKAGARYVRQPVRLPLQTEEELIDQLWQGVTPHTKLIYLSHITSPTSLHLPLQAICRRAHSAGILTVIDGAHAPGQIPLDLLALDADFYSGNCHKWMLSPKGAGFLYAHPRVQSLVEPLVVSWGYHAAAETSSGSRFIDYLQWTGTTDPAAALSVPSAIQFMAEHNWEGVRQECHRLLQDAVQRICDLTGLSPLYPLVSNFYNQMASIPLPQAVQLSELKTRLYDEYHIEVPVMEWQGRKLLRVSVQGYNTPEDMDALVDALEALLPLGTT